MAALEAPLRYSGIARQSAAFRLMKQMGWEKEKEKEKEKGLGKINKGSKVTLELRTNRTQMELDWKSRIRGLSIQLSLIVSSKD